LARGPSRSRGRPVRSALDFIIEGAQRRGNTFIEFRHRMRGGELKLTSTRVWRPPTDFDDVPTPVQVRR
jgi:hypothetical protein